MKVKARSFSRITLVVLLTFVFCFSVFAAVGCGKKKGTGGDGSKSIFKDQQATYVLEGNYQLSKADESARKGAAGEVKLGFATTIDLAGYTLDLNGRTLTIASNAQDCLVTLKNGTIKGGKLNVSVPNGDIDFASVEIAEDVKYDLQAASQTIRMSNSTLKGLCTIKSNTHVEIAKSTIEDITLAGNGYLSVGSGASLKNVAISESAGGATVNVLPGAEVTGGLSVGAAANVVIGGSVASVDVKENVATTSEAQLNVTVGASATVSKIDIKSAATVSLAGTVTNVTVNNTAAAVTVASEAAVSKVEMKVAAEVKVEGSVSDIVVAETAKGATVDIKESASVKNVVVNANDTQIKVENTSSLSSVKVVDTVTGTQVPDTVIKETITKDDADKYFEHTHAYVLKSRTFPTCTENGKNVYECIDKDDTYEVTVKALGHDYKYTIIKMATETANGVGRYTCKRCGHTYDTVIEYQEGLTIKINGLSELLKKAFGNGISMDMSGTQNITKNTVKYYDKDCNVESQKVTYQITDVEQMQVKLNIADINNLTGSINVAFKEYEVDDLTNVDLNDLSKLKVCGEAKTYIYIENNYIYVLSDQWDNDYNKDGYVENELINITTAMEYAMNSPSTPQPVKMIMAAITATLEMGETEVDFTDIQNKLQGVIASLGNVGTGDNALGEWLINSCFDKVTGADGVTTYTLNLEKAKASITNYGAMTISQFIDNITVAGKSTEIKDALNLVPMLKLESAMSYLSTALGQFNLTLEDLYGVIDFVVGKASGQPFDTAAIVKEYGAMKLADALSLMNNITVEEAQQMVDQTVAQVVGAMDAMTVDQLATMLYEAITSGMGGSGTAPIDPSMPEDPSIQPTKPTQPVMPETYGAEGELGGETPAEEPAMPSLVEMLVAMIDQYKQAVSLVITTDEMGNVTVNAVVADQEFAFSVDTTDGTTLQTVYTQAGVAVANIVAKLTQTKVDIDATVMGYTANVDYDKDKGSFGLVVTQKVEVPDEKGEMTIQDQEFVKVDLVYLNSELTLDVEYMGTPFMSLTKNGTSGNLSFVVPMGQTAMPVTATWATVNGVTTVNIVMVMGEETVAYQLVLDTSVANTVNIALTCGGLDEANNYVKAYDVITANVNLVMKENVLTGFNGNLMVNEYLLPDLGLGGKQTEIPGPFGTSHSSESYMENIKFDVRFKEDVTPDTTHKAEAMGKYEKFSEMNFKFYETHYYGDNVSVTYMSEGDYYLVEDISYKANISADSDNIYHGYLTKTVKSYFVPATNGLMNALYMDYENICGDWYELNITSGVIMSDCIETQYYGYFTKSENGEYIPTEECQTFIEYTYEDYEDNSFECYYNTATKQAVDDYYGKDGKEIVHSYEIINKVFNGNSAVCEAGVKVTYKCSVCNDEYEINTHDCRRETTEYALKTSCGTCKVELSKCSVCGDENYYAEDLYNRHNFIYEEVEGREIRKCADCGLIPTVTTEVLTNETPCITRTTYTYTLNGETLLEVVVNDKDNHYNGTTESYQYWTSNVNDTNLNDTNRVGDTTANAWVETINKYIGLSTSLSAYKDISYYTYKCENENVVVRKEYEFHFVNGGNGRLELKYSDTGVSYYVDNYKVSDIALYFNDLEGYDFTSLRGVSATMNLSNKNHWSDGSGNSGYSTTYRFELQNKDEIEMHIRDNKEYASVNWYHYSDCYVESLDFRAEDGVLEPSHRYSYERHDTTTTYLGTNCCEDGRREQCKVCGTIEGEVYYSHNSWHYNEVSKEVDGMVIIYDEYDCCGSYGDVTINLVSDVVLTKNFYIAADKITLNLNGHTLDLNGYDMILYTYKDEDSSSVEQGSIVIEDKGKPEESGETTYGAIVNTADQSAGLDGLLVLCVNGGSVVAEGINITCDTFVSDVDSRTTLCDSVYNQYGYSVVLGSMAV